MRRKRWSSSARLSSSTSRASISGCVTTRITSTSSCRSTRTFRASTWSVAQGEMAPSTTGPTRTRSRCEAPSRPSAGWSHIAPAPTMSQRQKMLALGRLDQDLFGLARSNGRGSVTVFTVREGKLSGSENFELAGLSPEQALADVLNAFVSQYYASATHIPREVFVPDRLPDTEVIEQWLSERRGSRVSLRVPQRGKQRELLAQVAANAAESMRQLRIKLDYDEQRTGALLNDLQRQLNLPALPIRIECYDISNIQGKHPVGSMVVFEQGRPKPAHYRHFRIKTVQGANDFAMLQEVLRRRFARYARQADDGQEEPSFSALPDLVLIDGGKGQLSAAREVLEGVRL